MTNRERSVHTHSYDTTSIRRGWLGAAIMVAIIVAFYLLREHWGHALGLAPYLLLLACPLMHLFMHGKHGGHGRRDLDD